VVHDRKHIERHLPITELIEKWSYFLLGPRGTGKSWLVRHQLQANKTIDYIDLLQSDTYVSLQARPSLLESMISHNIVVIDEIQRVPELLNEVHRLIELKSIRFLLAGSSARKLKRGGANLLAGRAFNANLFPLTYREIMDATGHFELLKYLQHGGLPTVYTSPHATQYLHNYVETYLKEEIQAEALTRKLGNFTRFLKSAAQCHGQMINFTKLANDAQLAPNTVRDYFQILEDTLVAFRLVPWQEGTNRKAVRTAKYYFFDPGVVHALLDVDTLNEQSNLYGTAFEHFITMELRAYLSYAEIRKKLYYWRTKSQIEVDLVIGDNIAIEVKSAKRVSDRDNKGLNAIAQEGDFRQLLVVSRDPQPRSFPNGVRHIYWQDFLEQLWDGKII